MNIYFPFPGPGSDPSANIRSGRVLLRIGAFSLLGCLLAALLISTAHAQPDSRSQSYWQYAASGRISTVSTADIDLDGIHETLVLDENGRLALIAADGSEKWVYQNPGAITALGTVNVLDGQGSNHEVVLAGTDQLTLLSSSGEEVWRIPIAASTAPTEIVSYDYQDDGTEEILVLLASGQLMAFDARGSLVWQFVGQENVNTNANPQLVVADFDGDRGDEIVIGLFTPRRYSEVQFIDDELIVWRQAVSRRITGLRQVPFGPTGTSIAVATNFGQLELYLPTGELYWFRTVNRPISAMEVIELPTQSALAVGTTSGSVIAYSSLGRRIWTTNLVSSADREVLAILPAGGRTAAGQAPLAAVLGPISDSSELADILLLGNSGQTISKLEDTDRVPATRMVDVNGDSHYELLLARFATLQLIGLGVGSSEYVQDWEYSLNAAPSSLLVFDLDDDGEEEIIVGTQDGRLHSLGADRTIRWLNAPGEEIAFLDRVRESIDTPSRIAVVRHKRPLVEGALEGGPTTSWLELREPTGERLWQVIISSRITSLVVDDRFQSEGSTIYLGTSGGRVYAYDLSGNKKWEYTFDDLEGGVRQLSVVGQTSEVSDSILVTGARDIFRLTVTGDTVILADFASFEEEVRAIFPIQQPDDVALAVRVVIFTEDGLVHGLNHQGIEMSHLAWPYQLDVLPEVIAISGQEADEVFQENAIAFLIADNAGRLQELSIRQNRPEISWEMAGSVPVLALNWDDIDKDGQPDTGAIGTADGIVRLYDQLLSSNPQTVLELPLDSSLSYLSILKRTTRQSPDLLTITQNGRVRLIREEENRPPLLISPQVEVTEDNNSIGVQVLDAEDEPVTVQLEILDPSNGQWVQEAEQQLPTGDGRLSWTGVSLPADSDQLDFRFRFSDGFYQGYLTPPAEAIPVSAPGPDRMAPLVAGSAVFLGIAVVILYAQQSRTPGAQANRFYKTLSRDPSQTLPLLDQEYARLGGSPDFLLQLANRARRAGDLQLASLADGLFLLANRPQAGLPIITRSLDDLASARKDWVGLSQRRLIHKTGLALLEAPSITELSLMRPQFIHMLTELEEMQAWTPILNTLLPVLTNMRDSERVDSVEDRLVYLNQAALRLRQAQDQLVDFTASVERTLVKALTRRWSGLLSAEIEEQRGRAELEVKLKTKRLVPNGQTHVAMEIRNAGRAPAENIIASLDEHPAYRVCSEPQVIPFLPSGRSRLVRFVIEPRAEERFRVGLSLTFDDRNRQSKKAAFGDMVHLLPPVREFSPIANPYLPGTPLRRGSSLFYGREELFDFIAEHTGTEAQRNVFMLVGQRRTGKTSLLLRLEDYLPAHLLPVYLDCQSLGVTSGMPALLQEFAWHIADALGTKGLKIQVPELEVWQKDPTRVFQREFLPAVRALLPPKTILLLVFDEFEAFESMVADGILPRTFFPYMRHLIQHIADLGFVFVGTRRLEEMSADYWSVLFNIALYRKIDFLTDESATRLICEPVAPHIIYDDLAIDKLLRVTAGHPYFLQLVCYTLVKQANQHGTGYVTISDVNIALDEMLQLGEVHFAYLWQRSSQAERAVLAAAAHLMERNEPLHPEEYVEYLASFSIELDPAEVTHALNALVERDIMREVTEEGKALYELRIGLVGLWVSQNKSLSKLHVHLES